MEFDWLSLDGVSWWGVIAAFVAAMLIGGTWYAKGLFGAAWMKIHGLTDEKLAKKQKDGGIWPWIWTIVTAFATALLLAILMVQVGVSGVLPGAVFGLVLGLVFRLGAHVIHNGFAYQPMKLTLIDGFHDVVSLAVGGALIGIWA